jgi:hypothetical protein
LRITLASILKRKSCPCFEKQGKYLGCKQAYLNSGTLHHLPPAVGLAALARGLGFVVPTLRQKKAKDGAPRVFGYFKGAPPAEHLD